MVRELIAAQPFRAVGSVAFGGLCDGRIIQFVGVRVRKGGDVDICEGPVELLHGAGGYRLLGMLQQTPERLGHALPALRFNDAPVHLDSVLGSGLATVFLGTAVVKGLRTPVTAKWRTDGNYKAEEWAYSHLHSHRATLPDGCELRTLYGKATGAEGAALLIGPPANTVANGSDCATELTRALTDGDGTGSVEPSPSFFTAKDWARLVAQIEWMHKACGVIHRDIKTDNIFMINGRVRYR